MKLIKFLLIFTVLTGFVPISSAFGQKNLPIEVKQPDLFETDDADLIISGTFPERNVIGRVTAVYDGDTCTILDKDKAEYKFRLSAIDAPEMEQEEIGSLARENLRNLIFGKEVTIYFSKVDSRGRYVGKITAGGTDINLEQIKAGLAWHYKEFAGEQSAIDRKAYSAAESLARADKKGLWRQIDPIPPWEFRAAQRKNREKQRETRKYLIGERGGCYYINSAGNKTYVDKQFCVNLPPDVVDLKITVPSKTPSKPVETKPAENKELKKTGGRTYIRGPQGGCYYLNENNRKIYVKDKSLCDN